MTLAHVTPGTWRRRWTSPKTSHWRYGDCAMVYYDTPDVAAAIRVEHRLGRLLRRLTRWGQRLRGA